jgi:DNA-binding NarL/FixJ family response regulator
MKTSILDRRSVLIVDKEPETLSLMGEDIEEVSPKGWLDTATSYQRARDLLASWSYDIAIIGLTGSEGDTLLKQAVFSKVPVVVVLANGQNCEAISNCMEIGVKAYIPRNKVKEIVPFLEQVLEQECMPSWKRIYEKFGSSLGTIKEMRHVNRPFPLSHEPVFYLRRAAQKATLIITF